MYREDYILRMFEQMADMAARLMQLNRRGDHDAALAEIERAWEELCPGPRGMIRAVDVPTLVAMLRHPAKLRVAAQLFTEEGHAWAGRGEAASAASCYRRAVALIVAARDIAPDEQDDAALRELRGLCEPGGGEPVS